MSSQNTKTEQVSTEALPKVTYYGNNEDAVGFENKSGATLTLTVRCIYAKKIKIIIRIIIIIS